MLTYPDQSFVAFFKDLAANNNTEWFRGQKTRYENDVKKPFYNLVQSIGNKYFPEVPTKNMVFRINRDIRFSKDKSPYKLHMSALFSSTGTKDHQMPGFYFELGPELVRIGGGAYFIEKNELERLRNAIAKDPKVFYELIHNKKITQLFGTLGIAEKNKKLPKPLEEYAKDIPEIYNKQFYFMTDIQVSEFLHQKDVIKTISKYFDAILPFNEYLFKSFGS